MSYYDEYEDLIPKVHLGKQIRIIASRTQVVDEFWEERVEALLLLTELMVDADPQLFCTKIAILKDCIIEQLKDLRSSVIKEVCHVIIQLAVHCAEHFGWMAENIIPSLLRLLGSSKVMAGYANSCIEQLVRSSCTCKLFLLIVETCSHKNVALRNYAYNYIKNMVCNDRLVPLVEKHHKKLLDILKNGLVDSSTHVRSSSASIFWDLYVFSPPKAMRVLSSIPERKQKTVLAAKPASITIVESQKKTATTKKRITNTRTTANLSKGRAAQRDIPTTHSLFSRVPRTAERRRETVGGDVSVEEPLERPKRQQELKTPRTTRKATTPATTSRLFPRSEITPRDKSNIPPSSRRESFHYRINKTGSSRSKLSCTPQCEKAEFRPNQPLVEPQRIQRQTISSKHTPKASTKENRNENEPQFSALPMPAPISHSTPLDHKVCKTPPSFKQSIVSLPVDELPSPALGMLRSKGKRPSAPPSPPLSSPTTGEFAMFSPAPQNTTSLATHSPGSSKTPSRRRARSSGYSLSPTRSSASTNHLHSETSHSHRKKKRISISTDREMAGEEHQPSAEQKETDYSAFESIRASLANATSSADQMKAIRALADAWEEICLEDLQCHDRETFFLDPLESVLFILQSEETLSFELIQESLFCLLRAVFCFSSCFLSWLDGLACEKFPFGGLIGLTRFVIAERNLVHYTAAEVSLCVFADQVFRTMASLLSVSHLSSLLVGMLHRVLEGNITERSTKYCEGIFVTLKELLSEEHTTLLFEPKECRILIRGIMFFCEHSEAEKARHVISLFVEELYHQNPLLFSEALLELSNQMQGVSAFWNEWPAISILSEKEIFDVKLCLQENPSEDISSVLRFVLQYSWKPIGTQQLITWTSSKIKEVLSHLTLLDHLSCSQPSIWHRLVTSQYNRLCRVVNPFLEFEEYSLRANRIHCYRLNELRLKCLSLYQKLLCDSQATASVKCSAVPRLFSMFANTLHPTIREECERCLVSLCSQLDPQELSSCMANICNSSKEEPEEIISDYFVLFTAIIKQSAHTDFSWIIPVFSSALRHILQKGSVVVHFSIFGCLRELHLAQPDVIGEILSQLTTFQQSLLKYRCSAANVRENDNISTKLECA